MVRAIYSASLRASQLGHRRQGLLLAEEGQILATRIPPAKGNLPDFTGQLAIIAATIDGLDRW
jgi:hypothetical protein